MWIISPAQLTKQRTSKIQALNIKYLGVLLLVLTILDGIRILAICALRYMCLLPHSWFRGLLRLRSVLLSHDVKEAAYIRNVRPVSYMSQPRLSVAEINFQCHCILYIIINSAFIGTPGRTSQIFLSTFLKPYT